MNIAAHHFSLLFKVFLILLLGGCFQSASVQKQSEQTVHIVHGPAPSAESTVYVDHSVFDTLPNAKNTPAVDIWSRIQRGQHLDIPDNDAVAREIKWHSNRQRYFNVMSANAEPYIFHILEEIDRRNMPRFLALLPIIESGYQPDVYSSWKAAGLWQFIPSTGKHFGLKQNWWYDGRRDVNASTSAALDYLHQLHDRFDDWLLAIAAYNSGQATVGRAIRKNKKAGKATDFWSLDLPPETRRYIPKLIALDAVTANPDKYQIELPVIANTPVMAAVETGGQLQLEKAAEIADIDIEYLRKLNPGFLRWATDPDGPHQLMIPTNKLERFAKAIVALPDSERVRWRHHKIQEGESLSTIAAKYHVRVSALKKANKLNRNVIRTGKILLIPYGPDVPDQTGETSLALQESALDKANNYRVKNSGSL